MICLQTFRRATQNWKTQRRTEPSRRQISYLYHFHPKQNEGDAARLTAALLVPLARSSDRCWANRWRSRAACQAGSRSLQSSSQPIKSHHVFHCCQNLPLPAGPPPPSSCASHHGPAPGVRGASHNAVRGGVLPPVDEGGGDLHGGDATAKVGVVWCFSSRGR